MAQLGSESGVALRNVSLAPQSIPKSLLRQQHNLGEICDAPCEMISSKGTPPFRLRHIIHSTKVVVEDITVRSGVRKSLNSVPRAGGSLGGTPFRGGVHPEVATDDSRQKH